MWVAKEALPGLRRGGLQFDWGLLCAVVALNGLAGALVLLKCLLTITPLCVWWTTYDVRGKLELGQLSFNYMHAANSKDLHANSLGKRVEDV